MIRSLIIAPAQNQGISWLHSLSAERLHGAAAKGSTQFAVQQRNFEELLSNPSERWLKHVLMHRRDPFRSRPSCPSYWSRLQELCAGTSKLLAFNLNTNVRTKVRRYIYRNGVKWRKVVWRNINIHTNSHISYLWLKSIAVVTGAQQQGIPPISWGLCMTVKFNVAKPNYG